MAQEYDDRSEFTDQLDSAEQVAVTIGLFLSGLVVAAGIAALLFVILHVTSTSPPSWGSQGGWIYGGVASILVAGWGFGRAATFYARRRRAYAPRGGILNPRIQIGSDGITFEAGAPRRPDAGGSMNPTWSWSFNSKPAPLKAFTLSEEQLAAADAAAQPGVDWDLVCRRIAPEYAALSAFEQDIYRQAVRMSVENLRRNES